jgi:hypothetical protein
MKLERILTALRLSLYLLSGNATNDSKGVLLQFYFCGSFSRFHAWFWSNPAVMRNKEKIMRQR